MLLKNMFVEDFLNEIANDNPAPGGGSVAAMAGAMAASLTLMALKISVRKHHLQNMNKSPADYRILLENNIKEFLYLIDDDAEAYKGVVNALRISKDNKELRRKELQRAYKKAALTPLKTVKNAWILERYLLKLDEFFSKAVASDVTVAKALVKATMEGAIANVKINLISIEDRDWVEKVEKKLKLFSFYKIKTD